MKARLSVMVIMVWAVLTTGQSALGEYAWQTYGGHFYALTDYGSWAEAEAEAVAAGAHLVAINSAEENAWLTGLIADVHTRQATDNIAWIGLEPLGALSWVSEDPVTYDNTEHSPNFSTWYLHGEQHVNAGTWNDNPIHDTDWARQPQGIIEVVPEPATLSLLALGGLAMLRRRRC